MRPKSIGDLGSDIKRHTPMASRSFGNDDLEKPENIAKPCRPDGERRGRLLCQADILRRMQEAGQYDQEELRVYKGTVSCVTLVSVK